MQILLFGMANMMLQFLMEPSTPKVVLKGFLAFSHVEIEIDSAENIRDFVKNSSKAQMRFFKDCGN